MVSKAIAKRLTIINGNKCFVMKYENNQHLVFQTDYQGNFWPMIYELGYWTTTPYESNNAYYFSFSDGAVAGGNTARASKLRLRCVKN